MKEKELKEILKHDFYWEANECFDKGLVHDII